MSDNQVIIPEINGELLVTRIVLNDGVMYEIGLKGGDIIGISLQMIQDSFANMFSISGDYIVIGQYGFTILGYKSPSTLVCKLSNIGDF